MRHVFSIVGLACMGKTTARRSVFQHALSFQAFSSDHTARLVMEAARLECPFSVQEDGEWALLDARVDVRRMKMWAYLEQLVALGSGPLACDGYGFFDRAEREILADALARLGGSHRVHYLHLLRPIDVHNRILATRGLGPVVGEALAARLRAFDLSFLDATVHDEAQLAAYAADWCKSDG